MQSEPGQKFLERDDGRHELFVKRSQSLQIKAGGNQGAFASEDLEAFGYWKHSGKTGLGMNSYTEDQLVDMPLSARLTEAKKKSLFFSLPLLGFFFIALVVFVLVPLRIAESDIWFHFRNALQLITSHSFLRADVYTFTSAGAPLLNHEWLSELPYYAGYKTFGLQGLLGVNALVLSLVFGGMYYLACRRGANWSDAAFVTIGAVVMGLYSSGPRMHNFGYLCLALLLITLERFQQAGKGLWLLPPLFAVWVNLHGSWLFGFIFMGIYLVSGLVKDNQGRVVAEPWKIGQIRKFLLAMAASGAALLLNPYGYRLVSYPFDLLVRQGANVANVVEWQSVDFNSGWGRPALFLLFLLLAVAVSKARWTVRDFLMVCFVMYLALTHVRFLQLAAIVLIPIIAPKFEFCPPYDSSRDKSWRNALGAAAIVALIVWSYPSAARLQAVIDNAFPHDALRFMQQNNVAGRLFQGYDFGGYIEWYAPEIKTFADGRTDIFVYNGVFDDYLKARDLKQPYEVLDKYNIQYVLYPPHTPLSYLLDNSSGWRVIYADSVANLYQRVPPTCPAVANQPSHALGGSRLPELSK